jgi:hypothetical protein
MKTKKVNLTLIIVLITIMWAASTILALTWGTTLNWSDYVHVNYGFPLVWVTHTLNTIAGPADIWDVNLEALSIDLFLWLGSMVAAVATILHVYNKKDRIN